MSVETRLLTESRMTPPQVDFIMVASRYIPLVLLIGIPALLLDFRSELDDSDESSEGMSAFVLLTALLFGVTLHTKLTEGELKQRRIRQHWNHEITQISSLVIDLELICKKHGNSRVLGFELIQDILTSTRSDALVALPFTEHVDFTLKLQNLLDEWMNRLEVDPTVKSWKPVYCQLMDNFLEHIHAVVEARFARISTKGSRISWFAWLHLCVLGSILFWGVLQLKTNFSDFNTALPILAAALICTCLCYLDYLDRYDPADENSSLMLSQLEEHAQHRILVSVSASHHSQRLAHPVEPTVAVTAQLDHFSTYPPRHTITSVTSSLEIDQQSVASSNFTTTLEETKHAL